MSHLLVVDDEPIIREEVARLLTREGFEVETVGTVAEAVAQRPARFDLVLTDLRLPDGEGVDLLAEAGEVPLVLMTAYGSIRGAVEAMRRGVRDYLAKPFDPDELLVVVRKVLQASSLERQNEALRGEVERQWSVDGIVAHSPPMQRVLSMVEKVAPTDATVLVLGESGTGKELVARAVHARSPRAAEAFVPVNCASIPEHLVESELFGHERGAFTGAIAKRKGLFRTAHKGTLFLDEIGELNLAVQARLLRVLQEHEVRPVGATEHHIVDVRIVAATHRDLAQLVEEGRFRRDLFYRLRVLEIRLPPLSERGKDRRLLAEELLKQATERQGRAALSLSPRAVAAIEAYEWPGNVRELQNALERAVILHEEGPITPTLLGLPEVEDEGHGVGEVFEGEEGSLEAYFRTFVLKHQGELSETELARRLGISRKTLWLRRKKMGLSRPG